MNKILDNIHLLFYGWNKGVQFLLLLQVLDLLKKQNSTAEEEEDEIAKEKLVNLSKNLDKPQMMTPSVSIAPIKHESKSIEIVNDQDEEKPKGWSAIISFLQKWKTRN